MGGCGGTSHLCYEIRIRGHLDADWLESFPTWTLTPLESGDTLLKGTVVDQCELYGLISRFRDLNVKLISLYWVDETASKSNVS